VVAPGRTVAVVRRLPRSCKSQTRTTTGIDRRSRPPRSGCLRERSPRRRIIRRVVRLRLLLHHRDGRTEESSLDGDGPLMPDGFVTCHRTPTTGGSHDPPLEGGRQLGLRGTGACRTPSTSPPACGGAEPGEIADRPRASFARTRAGRRYWRARSAWIDSCCFRPVISARRPRDTSRSGRSRARIASGPQPGIAMTTMRG
jgi:hypothetical protein